MGFLRKILQRNYPKNPSFSQNILSSKKMCEVLLGYDVAEIYSGYRRMSSPLGYENK